MRRSNPDIDPKEAERTWCDAEDATARLAFTFKLVTPMYGGGVKAGKVDLAMPIRASALRGQLRFWWRLLYGKGRPSTEVFNDECALWGGIGEDGPKASQVAVRVIGEPAANLIDGRSGKVPSYALITEPGENPRLLGAGHSFDVAFAFAKTERQDEAIKALRWWASFAGVGARTRRGFGAVSVVHADRELSPVRPDEVAKLGGCMRVGKQRTNDALAAWRDAISTYQSFRQHRAGAGDKGRTNWPEADAIRRVKGAHARPLRHPVKQDVYPRASFGLPIVFHFKDHGDPREDLTLGAADGDSDRMASPLLLRPYWDGEKYRPLALLLPGWEERLGVKVSLGRDGTPQTAWPSDQQDREGLASQIEPMKDHGTDPLTAFMHYFETHGGR